MRLPLLLASLLPLLPLGTTNPALAPVDNTDADPTPEAALDPRQNGANNLPQLLSLASVAGIPVPTDNPSLLLALGPVAATLASVLPTASVLSVLATAAPSGFLSQIVHDPSYAQSFESAFAAGSSPSWFTALPTDVRSYLHTYSGYAGVGSALGTEASQAASVVSVVASASASASSAAASRTGSMSGVMSSMSGMMGSMTDMTGSMSGMTMSSATATATGSTQDLGSVSATPSTSGSAAAQSSATQRTASSSAGAAKETGALAAGAMAVVGIFGLAVAL